MSRLQVCVDLMDFPFGSVMVIGLAAGRMFTVGAPATRKCSVAPESESAHLTALVTLRINKLAVVGRMVGKVVGWIFGDSTSFAISTCVLVLSYTVFCFLMIGR